MHLTAMQQCARLRIQCILSPASPHKPGDIKEFVEELRPDAAWYVLGYAFGSFFGISRMKNGKEGDEALKKAGLYVSLLPQAVGPFKNQEDQLLASQLLPLFDYIAVRDAESMKPVKSVAPGVEVQMIQDIVFVRKFDEGHEMLKSATPRELSSRPKIGLRLSQKMQKMMDDNNGKCDSTVRTLLSTLTTNLSVVLIPHEETYNKARINTTSDKTDRQIVRDYYIVSINELGVDKSGIILCDYGSIDVEVVEQTVKDLGLLVVMRYHTMIVATREGKVSAAHSWAPKYQAVLDGAGVGDSGILSFDDSEEAIRKIWTLCDRRSELEPKIRAFARANRARFDKIFEEVANVAETSELTSN
jgi:polysaccharide pyruvyl transferase WcaK-like protein